MLKILLYEVWGSHSGEDVDVGLIPIYVCILQLKLIFLIYLHVLRKNVPEERLQDSGVFLYKISGSGVEWL
jgi:hypothetical protein